MDYKTKLDLELTDKLNEINKDLPVFCHKFFIGISQTTSIKTRLGYAHDLKTFFNFLCSKKDEFKSKTLKELELKDLDKIKPFFIEEFLNYLSLYIKENKQGDVFTCTNKENAKSRKLSAIRSLYNYFYKTEQISSNPANLVATPKIYNKQITHLEANEVANLLDLIEEGTNLTKVQKKYHKYNKTRDFAIITLLLGTGIRISECVGININDIDFNINGIKIIRKGGNETVVYFGSEVEDSLLNYLNERNLITPIKGNEDALFLSMQRKRITPRAVQNLVKKYSSIVTPLKNISPHKLRSTYGTNLYEETGDIYLVADALGHADVNTTKKHYAKMSDENRRRAAKVIKLR